jgi:hypothetical protein
MEIYPPFEADKVVRADDGSVTTEPGRAIVPITGLTARLFGNRTMTQFYSGFHGTHKVDYPVGNMAQGRYRFGTEPDNLTDFYPSRIVPISRGGVSRVISLPTPLPANYSITKMGRLSTPYQIQFIGRHGGPAIDPNLLGLPHNSDQTGAPIDNQELVGDVKKPQVDALLGVAGKEIKSEQAKLIAAAKRSGRRPPKPLLPEIEYDPRPRVVRSMQSHPFPFASYPHETGLRKGDQD